MRVEFVSLESGRSATAVAPRAAGEPGSVVVEHHGDACRLHAGDAVRLNGCPVADAPLADGDLLELGDGRRFRVRVRAERAARRGATARGVVLALLLTLLAAGVVLGDRAWDAPERPGEAEIALARGRELERRRYEGRLEQVRIQLADLERRMAPRSTVEEQVGEVRQAVAQVERSVNARIGSEVARSIDTHPDLHAAREALRRLEREQAAIERLLARCSPSVCLIQGAYGFGEADEAGFRFLREASPERVAGWDDLGERLPLVFDGDGAVFRVDFTGTGFLVDSDGVVLTNRHIAEPWWKSATAEPLLEQGFEPRFLYLRAFFPGRDVPVEFRLDATTCAEDADLAALRFEPDGPLPPALPLAGGEPPAVGRRVVLLGYPSGLDALLARAEEDLADRYLTPEGLDERGLLDALAARHLVRPLPSQGHVSDVLDERILFDAPTALGGSGGPLLDLDGRVVAINYGILKAFSRANFGVPADRAARLLAVRCQATPPPR